MNSIPRIIRKGVYYQENIQLIPGLETYTGKPCVYVRWIESEQACYVGRTECLFGRYGLEKLREIIYFEEYEDNNYTYLREAELIYEFQKIGVVLANYQCNGKREKKTHADYN